MSRMIFVNLPVKDLERSKAFYEAIGFRNEPKFSNDAAAILSVDLLNRFGIEFGELGVQFVQAHGVQSFTQLWIGFGQRRESVCKRFDVKSTAADDQNLFAPRVYFFNDWQRHPAEFPGIHLLRE